MRRGASPWACARTVRRGVMRRALGLGRALTREGRPNRSVRGCVLLYSCSAPHPFCIRRDEVVGGSADR